MQSSNLNCVCSRACHLAGRISRSFTRRGLVCGVTVGLAISCLAQIGGQTSADGPFTLDDIEDLDINASSVGLDWIPDYIKTDPNAFAPIRLQNAGLSLQADQTSVGAFRFSMPSNQKGGYISYSFGVPMPSETAQSTLDFPGDLTSFTDMTFLVSSSQPLPNQFSSVLLETYVTDDPPYPQIAWNFTMPTDGSFQRVTLPLREPVAINDNPTNKTIEQLLAQTRYLAFYFYGGPQSPPVTFTVHIDDIRFIGDANQSAVSDWSIY